MTMKNTYLFKHGKKYLILCAIFIASCSEDTTTRPTECNLGNNRFELIQGDTVQWHVRSSNGFINKGTADFRGCFTKFGGLNVAEQNYYDPLFRLGDTGVSFMGVEYKVTFDYLDSIVMRHDERDVFTVVRLSK